MRKKNIWFLLLFILFVFGGWKWTPTRDCFLTFLLRCIFAYFYTYLDKIIGEGGWGMRRWIGGSLVISETGGPLFFSLPKTTEPPWFSHEVKGYISHQSWTHPSISPCDWSPLCWSLKATVAEIHYLNMCWFGCSFNVVVELIFNSWLYMTVYVCFIGLNFAFLFCRRRCVMRHPSPTWLFLSCVFGRFLFAPLAPHGLPASVLVTQTVAKRFAYGPLETGGHIHSCQTESFTKSHLHATQIVTYFTRVCVVVTIWFPTLRVITQC